MTQTIDSVMSDLVIEEIISALSRPNKSSIFIGLRSSIFAKPEVISSMDGIVRIGIFENLRLSINSLLFFLFIEGIANNIFSKFFLFKASFGEIISIPFIVLPHKFLLSSIKSFTYFPFKNIRINKIPYY